jgi:hypothetical protein
MRHVIIDFLRTDKGNICERSVLELFINLKKILLDFFVCIFFLSESYDEYDKKKE